MLAGTSEINSLLECLILALTDSLLTCITELLNSTGLASPTRKRLPCLQICAIFLPW